MKIYDTLYTILYLLEIQYKSHCINSIICVALYYFSKNNFLNQKILKKKFDYFLERIKNESFHLILTQSVNLIKDNPSKSRKYIAKIFKNFKFENIEDNIEIISVLKSFTYNILEENISENQVYNSIEIRKLYLKFC